jgi:hypothetical protein
MPVGNRNCFIPDHIRSHKGDTPLRLAEQAVHCLELVAELVENGLSFQFKGGNSLLVILQSPRRFSIDVDIATDEPVELIERVLDTLVGGSDVFLRWEPRRHKTKPWIPLTSYYLFYKARCVDESESNVMLDVQLGLSPYRTEPRRVRCGRLFDADTRVELPLPAGILGDKLLTMGPGTLGIPVGKGKHAQRLKHANDIAALLDTDPLLTDIRESFLACMAQENQLQQRHVTLEEVCEDTMHCCGSVMPFAERPSPDAAPEPILAEHVQGIDPFREHLFSKEYGWDALRGDLARVALCIAGVENEAIDDGTFGNTLRHSGSPSTPEEARFLWDTANRWRPGDAAADITPGRTGG